MLATLSASTTLTPPCRYPNGWWCLSSTGIVATTRSGVSCTISMPRFLVIPSPLLRTASMSTPLTPEIYLTTDHILANPFVKDQSVGFDGATSRKATLWRGWGRGGGGGGGGGGG